MEITTEMSDLIEQTLVVSRELGRDQTLVLHGGGNTSVKNQDFIWAKASGYDLGELDSSGLVQTRRAVLQEMLTRPSMTDIEMVDGYREALCSVDDASPTIEALVHHVLPQVSVLHSHADGIVALSDIGGDRNWVHAALGDDILVLPFVMPGWALARVIADAIEEEGVARWSGILLRHHGLFTFGDSVVEAREAHFELVQRAVDFLRQETGSDLSAGYSPLDPGIISESGSSVALTQLREDLGEYGLVEVRQHSDSEVIEFLGRSDLDNVSQRGPTTLEHVIRTKRVPMLGRNVDGYVADYVEYYERNRDRSSVPTVMLSPGPRVILDGEFGLLTAGETGKAAQIAMDIYRHTIRIIQIAERLGGYATVTEGEAFDIEYWELEQRKLRS